jgi:hypothetical protein
MAKIDECLEMRESMLVLLLEDQPLIAMDTEATLRRAGFANIVHPSMMRLPGSRLRDPILR